MRGKMILQTQRKETSEFGNAFGFWQLPVNRPAHSDANRCGQLLIDTHEKDSANCRGAAREACQAGPKHWPLRPISLEVQKKTKNLKQRQTATGKATFISHVFHIFFTFFRWAPAAKVGHVPAHCPTSNSDYFHIFVRATSRHGDQSHFFKIFPHVFHIFVRVTDRHGDQSHFFIFLIYFLTFLGDMGSEAPASLARQAQPSPASQPASQPASPQPKPSGPSQTRPPRRAVTFYSHFILILVTFSSHQHAHHGEQSHFIHILFTF